MLSQTSPIKPKLTGRRKKAKMENAYECIASDRCKLSLWEKNVDKISTFLHLFKFASTFDLGRLQKDESVVKLEEVQESGT